MHGSGSTPLRDEKQRTSHMRIELKRAMEMGRAARVECDERGAAGEMGGKRHAHKEHATRAEVRETSYSTQTADMVKGKTTTSKKEHTNREKYHLLPCHCNCCCPHVCARARVCASSCARQGCGMRRERRQGIIETEKGECGVYRGADACVPTTLSVYLRHFIVPQSGAAVLSIRTIRRCCCSARLVWRCVGHARLPLPPLPSCSQPPSLPFLRASLAEAGASTL